MTQEEKEELYQEFKKRFIKEIINNLELEVGIARGWADKSLLQLNLNTYDEWKHDTEVLKISSVIV